MSKAIISALGRHFVGLAWIDRSPLTAEQQEESVIVGDIAGRVLRVSGFLFSVADNWFIVTAGHILHDIEKAIEGGRKFEKWQLHDHWSHDAPHHFPIPFPINASQWKYFFDKNEGKDYGIIPISDLIRANLEANKKQPISEPAWSDLPTDFEEYFVFGLPSQLIDHRRAKMGMFAQGLVLCPVKKKEPPEELITPFPRFYGWVKTPVVADDGSDSTITHLDGFSGSPIIGTKRHENGIRYYVVAIQSGWHGPTETLTACPLKVLGEALAAFLKREAS